MKRQLRKLQFKIVASGIVIAIVESERSDRKVKLQLEHISVVLTVQFEEVGPLSDSDAGRLANIFNSDVALSPATDCATVFRLDFHTSEGDSEIEFMCSDDKNAAQVFWNGLEGRAPVVGRIIGPYLTGGPIPSLPTASP